MDLLCLDSEATLLGIFNLSIAPSLLFYSYVPIIVIILIAGFYILWRDKASLVNKLLLALAVTCSFFLINEIVLWTAIPAAVVYFGWALSLLLLTLIHVWSFYFVYAFTQLKNLPLGHKAIVTLVMLPVLVLLPSDLNVSYFVLDLCEAVTGPLWYYLYFIHLVTISALTILGISVYKKYRNEKTEEHLKSFYTVLGTIGFLLIFFASYFYGEITGLFEVNLIGPVGLLIFIGTLGYLVVRFKAFNTKLAAPVVLVFCLWALVFSLLFAHEISTVRLIVAITLGLLVMFGIALIKSVRREVRQREEIEGLAEKLKRANKRLRELDRQKSEFVSIASHQLRSPLTAIRGYASMLKEGSFGAIPVKAKEAVERIHESSRFMALSIEDFLNVSRIEQGRMKYELSDFNLKEMAEKVVDEMRSTAIQKGLVLMFRSECSSGAIVHADIGKVRQVLYNLVDNAMKYTPKGSIMVVAHDNVKKKKMYVTISDTGVGMSKETVAAIFEKFVRAKNANAVNVSGTGLGLFVAKQMIEAMGGSVTPQSEGEGKGSKFIIELPLAQ